ncbi:MAG: TRAP transporter substrate-binding protein DctP [Oscillospiraceae bacterium]|nr:TRAP transporter substrate-binding protein DctP [Oscillospiraceae bacterium]
MNKKIILLALCAALVVSIFSACAGQQAAPATPAQPATPGEPAPVVTEAESFVLNLSHVFTPMQTKHQTLEEVAQRIYERSEGTIVIHIFPDGQLPTGRDGVEQVVRGSYFINMFDPGAMADWVPDFNALIGPMLYQSTAEYSAMCQTDFAQSLKDRAYEQGIKVLALDFNFGMRNVATVNSPVTSIDDMAGLIIRTPNSQLWIDTFQALGASPVAIAWAELYNALQTGVVDAFESSLSDMVDNMMWEVSNYVTMTSHFAGTGAAMMSRDIWERMTPEQQAIIQEEFTEGARRNNERSMADELAARATLEERGMEFIDEFGVEDFRARAAEAFETFPNLTPGVLDVIMAELENIRA